MTCSLSAFSQPTFVPGPYKAGALVKDSSGKIFQAKKDIARATVQPKAGASWLAITLVPKITLDILNQRLQYLEHWFYNLYTTKDSTVFTDGSLLGNGTVSNPYRVNPKVYQTIPVQEQ